MRWRRQTRVERLRQRGDVPGLLRLLGREDRLLDQDGNLVDLEVPLRVRVVEALSQLGDSDAKEGLLRALGDHDVRVRATALDALGSQLSLGTAEALARAMVRWRDPASRALRERALDLLVGQEEPQLGLAVAQALLHHQERGKLEEDDRAVLARLFAVPGGSDAAAALAQRLAASFASTSDGGRRRLVEVLAALGDDAVEPLLSALQDPDGRHAAAATLGAIRDRRAVPALVVLLDDEQAAMRLTAVQALHAIRDPEAAEPLLRATADEVAEVRDAAQDALGSLGTVGTVVGLAAMVQPLVGRIEELEAALFNYRSPLQISPPADGGTRWERLRGVLRGSGRRTGTRAE